VSVPNELIRAREAGKPVRVHRLDGEVLVAQVLRCEDGELLYAVLTSSRPERYAVCDSTGFTLDLAEIERVQVLEQPPPRWRARLE
jgi:hypothetical protein